MKSQNNYKFVRLFLLCIFLLLFVINTIYVQKLYFKIPLYVLSIYLILYQLTSIALIYLNKLVEYYKNKLYDCICRQYVDLLKYKLEYSLKYIETVEFNNKFSDLLVATNKSEILEICDFFLNYNIFSCKDKDNDFIVTLILYTHNLKKFVNNFDEEDLIKQHRLKQ